MNIFENSLQQLQTAADIIVLNKDIHEFLKYPMQELTVSIPVRMDDGSTKTFRGFRVRYNTALGPAKGGVRFHPEETIDTVRGLSALMTWKSSLLGLPLGGGKGGVICNPQEMSGGELERLSRGYIRKIYTNIGHNLDSLAPDINTNPQIMAWMVDEYLILTNSNDKGFTTGKPIILGGSEGRSDATARGGLYCLREALFELDLGHNGDYDIDNKDRKFTVAIQGYGNVGMNAHRLIEEMFSNAKVVAISNVHGGIYNPNGIKYSELKNPETFANKPMFNESNYISNTDLLELDVDVLIPAAMENVITSDNAEYTNSKIILELANGPIAPDADPILFENAVHVIPDFLANAGGVVVSHFEMVQNSQNYFWPEEEVYQKLDRMMTEAYHKVFKVSNEKEVDMRTAAYVLAVNRVVEAMKLRGWF